MAPNAIGHESPHTYSGLGILIASPKPACLGLVTAVLDSRQRVSLRRL